MAFDNVHKKENNMSFMFFNIQKHLMSYFNKICQLCLGYGLIDGQVLHYVQEYIKENKQYVIYALKNMAIMFTFGFAFDKRPNIHFLYRILYKRKQYALKHVSCVYRWL